MFLRRSCLPTLHPGARDGITIDTLSAPAGADFERLP